MRLMSGIDTAMPDIKNRWSYHAAWNGNDVQWEHDFRQIASCGFDLLRWGMPWSMVQPSRNEYRWDLIDPKVDLATRLGVEIFFPIVHFNIPRWLSKAGRHGVLSQELGDRLAEYTDKLLSRYNFRLVIPIVEVQMEAFQRGRIGNWQPHLKSRKDYEAMRQNLIRAFKASAAVAHQHGATVVCSEPAPEVQTVRDLGDAIDIAGIDLYPHVHQRHSVLGYLRWWWREIGKPLCLSEFGTPETYNPSVGVDKPGLFIEAGLDEHRVTEAKLLREALVQAHKQGIPIPIGGWYPGTGNIGWGYALTRDRSKFDCDRAGLVDLARQPDGSLKRVLCANLVREVIGLREIFDTKTIAASAGAASPAATGIPVQAPAAPDLIPTA
jgi:hypothetical protein